MSSAPTDQERATIRDYLAFARRRRVTIAIIALAGALFAGFLAVSSEKSYTASSSVRVRDASQSLGLVGLQVAQSDTPAASAAQTAETLVRTSVLERVRSKLGTSESVSSLRSRITTAQDAKSNLITLQATGPTGRAAADLANAVAEEGADTANRSTQRQYAALGRRLRSQAAQIQPRGSRRAEILEEQAARLQGLGAVIQLVQVATDASVPGSPASPKPVRNTIIGLILGLIVGLIVASLLETLDRRIRTPGQAEDEFGQRILAVLPDDAMGGVPIAGAPGDSHPLAMPVFQMLRTNVGFLNVDKSPKVVLVTSALPGEGKTTVSTGLALAAAASGRKTLLVEADLHRPTQSKRLGTRAEPGLVEYLTGERNPGDVLQRFGFEDRSGASTANNGSGHANLFCVSAGKKGAFSAELFASTRFSTFLTEVSSVYDLVVIDTAPLLAAPETLEIVSAADAVVYCVRLDQTTTDQLDGGRAALAKLPGKPTGLVVTGARGEGDDAYATYRYSYAYQSDDGNDSGGSRRLPRLGRRQTTS